MEEEREADGVLHKCHEGQSVVVEVGEEGDHKNDARDFSSNYCSEQNRENI